MNKDNIKDKSLYRRKEFVKMRKVGKGILIVATVGVAVVGALLATIAIVDWRDTKKLDS